MFSNTLEVSQIVSLWFEKPVWLIYYLISIVKLHCLPWSDKRTTQHTVISVFHRVLLEADNAVIGNAVNSTTQFSVLKRKFL